MDAAPAPYRLHERTKVIRRLWNREYRYGRMLLLAVVVGAIAGLLGSLFQLTIEWITRRRVEWFAAVADHAILSWALPIGLGAASVAVALWMVGRFAPETGGSGVQEVEGAMGGERPMRWWAVIPVKFVGGLLALGSGLVLGREGPTIQMGGAAGKMVSDLCRRDDESSNMLMAAGAGAGLAAAFNAPLSGILFVIEEMREYFRFGFLPFETIVAASVTSTFVLRLLVGQGPAIPMPAYDTPPLHGLWLFLIFGACFGLLGYLFNRWLLGTLALFGKLKRWPRWAVGLLVGGVVGTLIWLHPQFAGGGYATIPWALADPDGVHGFGLTGPGLLLLVFIVRFGSTLFSYGSGAPGGIFAPMLALGVCFGLCYGHLAHYWMPHLAPNPGVFAVAGMAALFAATVRAPLTGIALTVEMTHNYALILPLIITCLMATVIAEGLGGKPIYTLLLRRTIRLTRLTQRERRAHDA